MPSHYYTWVVSFSGYHFCSSSCLAALPPPHDFPKGLYYQIICILETPTSSTFSLNVSIEEKSLLKISSSQTLFSKHRVSEVVLNIKHLDWMNSQPSLSNLLGVVELSKTLHVDHPELSRLFFCAIVLLPTTKEDNQFPLYILTCLLNVLTICLN